MNPENPPTNTLPTPLTRRGFIAASAAVLSASPLAFASAESARNMVRAGSEIDASAVVVELGFPK